MFFLPTKTCFAGKLNHCVCAHGVFDVVTLLQVVLAFLINYFNYRRKGKNWVLGFYQKFYIGVFLGVLFLVPSVLT